MIQIDKQLIEELFAKAEASERKRMNYDLRTSAYSAQRVPGVAEYTVPG